MGVELEGVDRVWRAARFLKYFELDDVAATTGLASKTVGNYIRSLVSAGYVRVVSKADTNTPGSFHRYQLVRDTGPLAPKIYATRMVRDRNNGKDYAMSQPVTARDKAWRRMRELGQFSAHDLVDAGLSLKYAQKYLMALKDAGWIAFIWRSRSGKRSAFNVYEIRPDTPAEAPALKRNGSCYPMADDVLVGWQPESLPESLDWSPSAVEATGRIQESVWTDSNAGLWAGTGDAMSQEVVAKPRRAMPTDEVRITSEVESRCLGYLRVHGCLSIRQFDDLGGWNSGSVHRALRRLMRKGLVTFEVDDAGSSRPYRVYRLVAMEVG